MPDKIHIILFSFLLSFASACTYNPENITGATSPKPPIKPTPTCGNGTLEAANHEACDDHNTNDGDGCNHLCQVESGWTCDQHGCQKRPVGTTNICGDGKRDTSKEGCDDHNTNDGDGCNRSCQVEPGWTCTESSTYLSSCTRVPPKNCGNGIIESPEACDDGNTNNGDGCDYSCQVESSWTCISSAPTELPDKSSAFIYLPVTYVGLLEKQKFENPNNTFDSCPDNNKDPTTLASYISTTLCGKYPCLNPTSSCRNTNFNQIFSPINPNAAFVLRRFMKFSKSDSQNAYHMDSPDFHRPFIGLYNGSTTLDGTIRQNYTTGQIHTYIRKKQPHLSITYATQFDLLIYTDNELQTGIVGFYKDKQYLTFYPPNASRQYSNIAKLDIFFSNRSVFSDTMDIVVPLSVVPYSTCFRCGDGVVDFGETQEPFFEECDDGNTNDGDGCSSTCKIESRHQCTISTNGQSACT